MSRAWRLPSLTTCPWARSGDRVAHRDDADARPSRFHHPARSRDLVGEVFPRPGRRHTSGARHDARCLGMWVPAFRREVALALRLSSASSSTSRFSCGAPRRPVSTSRLSAPQIRSGICPRLSRSAGGDGGPPLRAEVGTVSEPALQGCRPRLPVRARLEPGRR